MKHFLTTCMVFAIHSLTFSQNLTDSLKAYYPFNGNANDASGYLQHGTVVGATLTTDRFGNPNSAYSFDGNDEIDIIPTSHLMPTTFPVSIAAWVKFTSSINPLNVFTTDNDDGNDYGYWMNFGTYLSGNMQLAISFGDGGYCTSTSRRTKLGNTPVNDNQWHLLVGVVRGPTDMDVYVDCQNDAGVYSGTGGTIAYSPSNHLTKIGYFHCTGQYHYFIGAIDEVRFYNRELTAADVAALYNYPNSGGSNMAAGILGNDTTICNGNITLDATSFWANNYLWSNGSTSPTLNVNAAGTYWVNITDKCGNINSDSIVISSMTQMGNFPDTVFCKGQTIILYAAAGYTNYLWNTGATTQSLSVASTGTYIVQATGTSGCNLTDTIVVTSLLQNAPMAQFTYTFQPFGMIQLNNTSLYSLQYQWTYSNGGTDTSFSPQHYFPCNVPITVTLVSSGRCGADTSTQMITYLCDGIEDITQQIDLQVFPQPAQATLNIEYDLFSAQKMGITLYNSLGQKVYEQQLSQQVGKIKQAISVAKWANGTYFLQVIGEKGIASKKVWIQH